MQTNSVYEGITRKINQPKNIITFLDNNELVIREIAEALNSYKVYCINTGDRWKNEICNKPENVFVFPQGYISDIFNFSCAIAYNRSKQFEILNDLFQRYFLSGHSVLNLIDKSTVSLGITNKQIIENNLSLQQGNTYFTSKFISNSWLQEGEKLIMFGNSEKRKAMAEKDIGLLVYVDRNIMNNKQNVGYIFQALSGDKTKIVTLNNDILEHESIEKVDSVALEEYMQRSKIAVDLSFDSNSILTMKGIRRNCIAFTNTEMYNTKNFDVNILSQKSKETFEQISSSEKYAEEVLSEQNKLLDIRNKKTTFQSILKQALGVLTI